MTGMHHRVRHIVRGDKCDAGDGAVRTVSRDPDRGDDNEQHGQDNDRGQRGHMRHRVDRRSRVHSGQQAPRQTPSEPAQLVHVVSPEQGRRRADRHAARQLSRRAQPEPDVVVGRPRRVQRPQGLGPGFRVQ